ncbi:MAG TPA: hypothetical protein VFA34_06045 [Actinomycetota bacterium]|jgi:hypothetical protein|nr:hypothetical protein [Actinomycetota bacterium]
MRNRARRLAAASVAAAIALAPFAAARAVSAPRSADEVIASGAGLAAAAVAVANVDPDFDIWPLYSESSFDNQSSHGLSGAIWPGFLLDAFAWLYGLQPQERGGFGISESQWPNPPHKSNGSSSNFMIESFADGCGQLFGPDACRGFFEVFDGAPAGIGESTSESDELSSRGGARGARFDYPGLVEATEAKTATHARFLDGRSVVESVFIARDITIGSDLHIDMIEARSVANAGGDRDHSDGESTLRILGARFGDTPVVIDDQGMHARGDSGTDDLNDALRAEGIEVRASQGRESVDATGEFVDAATGGLLVRVLRERVEEDVPEPLIAGKNAMCAAAEDNALNQEITRVAVDQPNPLYGQVPLPAMPQRVQVEQSVPPPAGCPFFNRNFELTIALGFTNASARLSPLPGAGELPAVIVPLDFTGGGGLETRTIRVPGAAPTAIGDAAYEAAPSEAQPVSSQGLDPGVARRIRILYGVIALLLVLGVAGRFVLRAASSP